MPPIPRSQQTRCSTYFRFRFSGAPLATLFEHILNIYTSGRSFIFATLKTVNEAFLDPFSTSFFLLLLGVLLSFLYTVFIQNVLLVGEARFFLEARTYQQTTISKLFFLYKVNFFSHPAWIMTCRCVFQTFWNLTFIGGIIKKYEYSMIPYILAENPTMGRKDAFFLSRQLMRGNNGGCFFCICLLSDGAFFLSLHSVFWIFCLSILIRQPPMLNYI